MVLNSKKQDFFLEQVNRWSKIRIKVGTRDKVTFKLLYADYVSWVEANTLEVVLNKGSFAHYLNIVFDDLLKAGRIRKITRHPIAYENLSLFKNQDSKDNT